MARKLSVTAFAKKHRVARMTVLRRIASGELRADKFEIEPARFGRPARFAWLIEPDAPFTKYQAGRPPKLSEIEQVVVGDGPPPKHKRKPAVGLAGGPKVVSIFSHRRR